MKLLNTHEQLGTWICNNVPGVDQSYPNIIILMCWFVCMQKAAGFDDASRKDIASMFLNGITPIATSLDVQEWLDTVWEDVADTAQQSTNDQLISSLQSHFGM